MTPPIGSNDHLVEFVLFLSLLLPVPLEPPGGRGYVYDLTLLQYPLPILTLYVSKHEAVRRVKSCVSVPWVDHIKPPRSKGVERVIRKGAREGGGTWVLVFVCYV